MYLSICSLSYINYSHGITRNTYDYLVNGQLKSSNKKDYNILVNTVSACITSSVIPAIFIYSPFLEMINYKQYLTNIRSHSKHQNTKCPDHRQ